MESCKKHHFVLVHGLGQGAWSWYKVKTMLESLGHQVTAIDLAASGINLMKLREVHTMLEYSLPLLEFMEKVNKEEKVILVGHSLGGFNIAYAMDRFPEKVYVGVFLTAFLPDTWHYPGYVIDKWSEDKPREWFLDSLVSVEQGCEQPKTTILWGPKYLATKGFQLSPDEDLVLGILLRRVGSTFQEDLRTAEKFSEEGYGSVNRAYIVCQNDKNISADFQRWMIENFSVADTREIKRADHFAMFSSPQDVSSILLEFAAKYS